MTWLEQLDKSRGRVCLQFRGQSGTFAAWCLLGAVSGLQAAFGLTSLTGRTSPTCLTIVLRV